MANDDRNLPSRLAPVITVVALLLVGSLVPKGGVSSGDPLKLARGENAAPARRDPKKAEEAGVTMALAHEAAKRSKQPKLDVGFASLGGPDLSAYESLGSWIDIYDEWPWDHPSRAVHELDDRGVRTVFLQTSNWGAKTKIFRPQQTKKFLKAAHRRDMKVVSWYVPSFAKRKEDFKRSKAAALFNRGGERFDSFGLDIESTVVGDIALRNRRLIDLSKRLRRLVGPDYTLGAITPDPVKALYWPDFPYERVSKLYDVFVPMGYFSFRTDGYRGVKKYTVAGIRNIRRESGDPDVPIHLIGGIGGETKVPEVKAFVRAVKGNDVLGGSYYDMTVTSDQEWQHLETIADEPSPTPSPTPAPEPAETEIVAAEVRPTPLTPTLPDEAKGKDKADKKKSNERDKKSTKKERDKRSNKKSRKNDEKKRSEKQGPQTKSREKNNRRRDRNG